MFVRLRVPGSSAGHSDLVPVARFSHQEFAPTASIHFANEALPVRSFSVQAPSATTRRSDSIFRFNPIPTLTDRPYRAMRYRRERGELIARLLLTPRFPPLQINQRSAGSLSRGIPSHRVNRDNDSRRLHSHVVCILVRPVHVGFDRDHCRHSLSAPRRA